MHYELLPDPLIHDGVPFAHAAVNNAGKVKAVFEEERDVNYWLEVTDPDFDPMAKHAITELDLAEGTRR